MVYSFKFSNRMTNDNYISKLKGETVFSKSSYFNYG